MPFARRDSSWASTPDHPVSRDQNDIEYLSLEVEQDTERLILSRNGDLLLGSQMLEITSPQGYPKLSAIAYPRLR